MNIKDLKCYLVILKMLKKIYSRLMNKSVFIVYKTSVYEYPKINHSDNELVRHMYLENPKLALHQSL